LPAQKFCAKVGIKNKNQIKLFDNYFTRILLRILEINRTSMNRKRSIGINMEMRSTRGKETSLKITALKITAKKINFKASVTK